MRLHPLTKGQFFADCWKYADSIDAVGVRNCLSIATDRYCLTGAEPTKEELAQIGFAWGAIKAEIDRINEIKEKIKAVRSAAGHAGAKKRWGSTIRAKQTKRT